MTDANYYLSLHKNDYTNEICNSQVYLTHPLPDEPTGLCQNQLIDLPIKLNFLPELRLELTKTENFECEMRPRETVPLTYYNSKMTMH